MSERVRPYVFYDVAVSICSTCYQRVEAKIVFQDNAVYMLKWCPTHGHERVLMADDIDYYRRGREVFIKTPEMPHTFNTPMKWGCPYDCGLCPDHQQHSCVTIIEITDHCNLTCPICYAESSPARPRYRSVDQVQRMIDAVVRNEGQPDIVQLSGGEPTMHPDFLEILDRARAAPIRHVMVNTNGIRIATDEAFANELAARSEHFEVYLQFDSFEREALMALRGADLRDIRRRALDRLNALGIATTLVVTLKKGLNDHEIGKIIDFALEQPAVRGVTLQPIQAAGRLEHFNPATDRLTLTEVRRRILEQTSVFAPEDILPVPCHPDCLAMAYALKIGGQVMPLTRLVDPQVLIEGGRNTILYEQDERVTEGIFRLFATNHSPESSAGSLRDLLCCLPRVDAPAELGYQNVFRLLIMQFIDAYSFDLRSVKKSCVHFVHPDGRLIPFDTYNLFYRDGLEAARLGPLRLQARATAPAPGAPHETHRD
jgi:uncharacterized radical SAM superfamily Fe-S cluster-containing enzyme